MIVTRMSAYPASPDYPDCPAYPTCPVSNVSILTMSLWSIGIYKHGWSGASGPSGLWFKAWRMLQCLAGDVTLGYRDIKAWMVWTPWSLWSMVQGLEYASMTGRGYRHGWSGPSGPSGLWSQAWRMLQCLAGDVTLEYRDIQAWMVWTPWSLWSMVQGLEDASMSGRGCHSGV